MLMSVSIQLVRAADDLTVSQPPINPVQNTQILLPGAAGNSETGAGAALQQIVIPSITNLVIEVAGGLSLLFVIIGGIQILTAYGNEEHIRNAKKTIMFALAGLIIAILSYAIVQIIVTIRIFP